MNDFGKLAYGEGASKSKRARNDDVVQTFIAVLYCQYWTYLDNGRQPADDRRSYHFYWGGGTGDGGVTRKWRKCSPMFVESEQSLPARPGQVGDELFWYPFVSNDSRFVCFEWKKFSKRSQVVASGKQRWKGDRPLRGVNECHHVATWGMRDEWHAVPTDETPPRRYDDTATTLPWCQL